MRPRIALHYLILVLLASTGAALLFFNHPGHSSIFPPCPFYWATGLYCPGCGTLRGIHLLLHGNIIGALDSNPLMLISAPFMLYAFIVSFFREVFQYRLPAPRISATHVFILLTIILCFGILRNIDVYPFNILAP